MTATNPHSLTELFHREREGNKSEQTIYKNRDHTNQFLEWCDAQGIDSIRDLDGTLLLEYKLHLKDDPNKGDATIRNHFSTLRTFFKFCRRVDATKEDQHLYEKLKTPDFSKGELSRDDMMDFGEVKRLLDYLNKFEYGTVKHVAFAIFWHTGCRCGALISLDVDDYKPVKQREHGEYGVIQFTNRPDTGTRLKNGEEGNREVVVWPHIGEIIEDYIEINRKPQTDDYGREPLLTSKNGRYSGGAVQRMIYALTRPCHYTGNCPVNRDVESCEAIPVDAASKCPESLSPHPMRRTAITYHLEKKDWTYEAASGRFDVSQKVLDEHYDESTDEGRRKTRASIFFDGDQSVI
ncbi:phage integrase SAM-like domain-containing protein [Halalkaliarchaeum sp. AArc-GB]|uniref:tyrosine-type recombinase/integrase n=1 Tax=Halalkaliarchaeum sp. AArc-GB TaxID=3074078 RepID=UPI0028657667|nr:phage integrase SAM-like domain-containing protein [Halalkaliarchaeum sp. AArc-GB]MDR5674654.1 phage integrase SAM-like domain-containing protein [Halalkaliarchaeum sp. AArc-GB]